MKRALTALAVLAVGLTLHLLVRTEITAYQDLRSRVDVAEKQAEIRGIAVVQAYDALQARALIIAQLQAELAKKENELNDLKRKSQPF